MVVVEEVAESITTTAPPEDARNDIPVETSETTKNEASVQQQAEEETAPMMEIPEGWKELMGKDLLMKTLQEAPADATSVQPQDAVVIDFVGQLAPQNLNEIVVDINNDINNNNNTVFQRVTDWTIVIGEKDVLPCLEMGVRFMRVGETAVIWSHSKYAYGAGQRQSDDDNAAAAAYTLPAYSNVCFTVTVKRILTEDLTKAAMQVQMARMKKIIGNDIYKHECIGEDDGQQGKLRARQQYQRGADTMQYLLQTAQEEDDDITSQVLDEARQILLDCLNNIAALHLRHKEYKLAKEAAVKVLTHEPDNFKGLIRAAKAALLDPGSSYEEVEAAIRAAAERSDGSATQGDLQRLRAEFKRRKQAYKKKSKQMFSKIGQAIGSDDGGGGGDDNDGDNNNKSAAAGEKAEESNNDNDNNRNVAEESQENAAESVEKPPPTTTDARDTDGSDKKEPTSSMLLNWREWDWKNKILPYGFQLSLTCLMFWYYTILKRREQDHLQQQQADAASSPGMSHDEF